MAAQPYVSDPPLKCRNSFPFLPPDLAELRVVLLGNSWSERSSVGNFLLGKTVFNPEEEPDQCFTASRHSEDKTLVLINTPNFLQQNISQIELTQHVELCARSSDPGPHVFLLVIQPEDFTEENSRRLQSFMENFSEQSWKHSILLISTPEEETPSRLEETFPSLRTLIKKCRYKLLWNKNLQQNLLTCMKDMMEENNGEHVTRDVFRDASSDFPAGSQSLKQEPSTSFNQRPVAGDTHGLRIVLFGESDDKKTFLGNTITGKQEFKVPYIYFACVSVSGEWKQKPFTVVKTPDVFKMSVEAVRKEMKRCVDLCSPGPNVLLLLVRPSDFTEDDRKTLMFILNVFGQDVFKHSMVVLTHEEERHHTVNQLIQTCQQNVHSITDWKDPSKHEVQQLMQKIEDIAITQRGEFLVVDRETDVVPVERKPKPGVNLVLFGRRGAGKTSAVKAILGQGRFGPAANSSECVRTQGEVGGRWVSVVELPALYGRPQEEVMEECLRCVSLCDPEGVHAFILVLPVGPLTDEDKGELQTIQKTFSSSVNDFTMILFTVDSDPSTLNFLEENKELQDLCQSYSGEHFVLNIHGRQELSRLFYNVDTMRRDRNGPDSYTTNMFHQAQIRKILQQEKNNNLLQSELQNLKEKNTGSCEEEKPNTDCLRIVLLGKTGSGKSSSGNTILGREEFRAELGGKSVTKQCQKAVGEVDNRTVAVVDTPGLFDTSLSNEEINREMVKCVSLLAPGPHVFLLVVRIGRFTEEEKETLKLIREGFGTNSQHFAFILLTGGDELEKSEMSVEEYIRDRCDDSFKSLLADCGGRFHVFNNYDRNPDQVKQLISKIDNMVKKNGGDCFTNEMLQEAEAAIVKEMEKLLKGKEEEMKREREEVEKKHQEEMQKMMMRMEEERAKLEDERKLIKEQLNEKEENIRKERELRKREQEEREEEDRKKKGQEENQRREWKQKLDDLEKKIKSESDQKKFIDKKLVEEREEKRKEREIWEEKRKEWWEQREKENKELRQKEQIKLAKLQEEFEQEKEKYEHKRRKDVKKKLEAEEKKRQELEENYTKELENMKKKHEDEARKQAEEFNEFKTNKEKELAALIDKHMKDVIELKDEYSKNQQEQKKESEEKEKSLKTQMDELLDKHKEELADMTLVIVNQRKINHEKLQKLQRKHKDDMNELLFDLKKSLDRKVTEEINRLKRVQQNEMAALKKEPQTENKEQRMVEMSKGHEEEIKTMRTKVEDKHKQKKKKKMDELQKQQDEEMNKVRGKILDEVKLVKAMTELEKRQDEEMKTLYQKIKDGDDVKEFEELRKKHEVEMKKLKERLSPQQCTIL